MNTPSPRDERLPGTPGDDPDALLAGALSQARVMQHAPESVIQRALAVFQARAPAASTAEPPSGLRRWVAKLVPEGPGAGQLALRSPSPARRQMLFTSEAYDVDLRVEPGENGWHLSGQVLGPEVRGEVLVRGEAGFQQTQPWSDLAEFQIDGVPAGPCRIVLHTEHWAMELPELQLDDTLA